MARPSAKAQAARRREQRKAGIIPDADVQEATDLSADPTYCDIDESHANSSNSHDDPPFLCIAFHSGDTNLPLQQLQTPPAPCKTSNRALFQSARFASNVETDAMGIDTTWEYQVSHNVN